MPKSYKIMYLLRFNNAPQVYFFNFIFLLKCNTICTNICDPARILFNVQTSRSNLSEFKYSYSSFVNHTKTHQTLNLTHVIMPLSSNGCLPLQNSIKVTPDGSSQLLGHIQHTLHPVLVLCPFVLLLFAQHPLSIYTPS